MDCGYECIKYLLGYYGIINYYLLSELRLKITKQGLSVFDIVDTCNKYHFKINGYKTKRMKQEKPYLMLLKGKNTGHFIVVLKVNFFSVLIYDPIYKLKKVNKLLLFLKFKYIILM